MLEFVAVPDSRKPVIEVNGEPIYADEIRTRMSWLRTQAEASGQELSAEQRFSLRPAAVKELVDQRLMLQEARRLELQPTDAEIDAMLELAAPKLDASQACRVDAADAGSREDIARRWMADRLLSRWLDSVRPPKMHDMKEFYRKNRESFWTPELIAAAHIVKHEEDGAADPAENRSMVRRMLEVRTSILAGEEFAAAAQRFSDCPEQGGDLGYFPRGVMVEEFDEVAFAAPIGEVTAPFRTQFGWHIVLVRDRKPEGVRAFDEVAAQIQDRMLRERKELQVRENLNALRTKAKLVELAKV